jgi:hypothetical protein
MPPAVAMTRSRVSGRGGAGICETRCTGLPRSLECLSSPIVDVTPGGDAEDRSRTEVD